MKISPQTKVWPKNDETIAYMFCIFFIVYNCVSILTILHDWPEWMMSTGKSSLTVLKSRNNFINVVFLILSASCQVPITKDKRDAQCPTPLVRRGGRGCQSFQLLSSQALCASVMHWWTCGLSHLVGGDLVAGKAKETHPK